MKQARIDAGLSLSEAAIRSGVQRSNIAAIENGRRDPTSSTIEKIASAALVRFVAVKSDGRSTVAEAAAAMADALHDDSVGRAYRMLVQVADDLTVADPAVRFVLAAERPVSVTPEWNAALAGVVEWRLNQARLPVPDWVTHERGDSTWAWTPALSPASGHIPADATRVPRPLRDRGILIEADEFASA
nr:helix-turn-helix transcriptional regulator [Herbiconiux sp. VKM Ac-1786]